METVWLWVPRTSQPWKTLPQLQDRSALGCCCPSSPFQVQCPEGPQGSPKSLSLSSSPWFGSPCLPSEMPCQAHPQTFLHFLALLAVFLLCLNFLFSSLSSSFGLLAAQITSCRPWVSDAHCSLRGDSKQRNEIGAGHARHTCSPGSAGG